MNTHIKFTKVDQAKMKEPEPPAYTRMRHSSEGMSCRLPCMKDSTSSNLLDEELPLGLLMTNGLKRIVR